MVQTMNNLVKKNPGVIFDLQLSIDNIKEKHDESRRIKNLYERAINTFNRLSEIRKEYPNLRLKVSILYLDTNKDDLDYMVSELSRTIDYDRIQIIYPNKLLLYSSTLEQEEEEILSFVEIERKISDKYPFTKKKDLHTVGMRAVKGIYNQLLLKAPLIKNVGSYCEAGRHLVVINEKGDVFPCEPLWLKIGNLRESDYDMNIVLKDYSYMLFREKGTWVLGNAIVHGLVPYIPT